MRYVVVGSGVAGVAAIEAIRGLDPEGRIDLIGDDPHGFYSRPGLAYLLTGEVPETQLHTYSTVDWRRLKIQYHKGRATRIVAGEHKIEMESGTSLPYDRLLLATGATAVPLEVPGAELSGVFKLDHFEDGRRIIKGARRGRTAVVVGGGITALELIEGLAARGVKTHYFLRGERYWSNVLDEAESEIVEERLKDEGVILHYNTEIKRVIGRKGRIVGIETSDGRQMGCTLVGYAVGIKPRLELARTAGLEVERGILVNENMQTSEVDIFAAGDAAQVYDPISKRYVLDSLWKPAREQGQQAGWNMAGKQSAYIKPVAFNVTRLAGLTTFIIGSVGSGRGEDLVSIARGDSETWHALPGTLTTETGSGVNHLRLMVGEKTLVGALLMGEQRLSRPLQDLVGKQVEICAIREQLLKPGAGLGNLIMEFWKEWRADGQ